MSDFSMEESWASGFPYVTHFVNTSLSAVTKKLSYEVVFGQSQQSVLYYSRNLLATV